MTEAETAERIQKLEAALIEHIDLYWGGGWRTESRKDHVAYAKLSRARQALGLIDKIEREP